MQTHNVLYRRLIIAALAMLLLLVINLGNVYGDSTSQIAAGKDTYIWEEPGSQGFNYGASNELEIKQESAGNKRGLIHFDLSGHSGEIVTSATLYMYLESGQGQGNIVEAYSLTRYWDEGAQNGTTGFANWDKATSTTDWTTEGGDFSGVLQGSMTTNALGWRTMSLPTELVQGWIDNPASNYGLILISDQVAEDPLEFTSREGTSGQRPYLQIETTVSISISDETVTEGDAGDTPVVFTVSLSAASSLTVTVDYATADNTATAGSDYIAASDTLTFTPGITSQPITVTVQGDVVDEINETYFVNLSKATNATNPDGQGVGTITDDDEPSPSCTTPVITLTATADTWINSAAFNQNYGYSDTLKTKSDFSSSNIERTLIQFDLSSIPADSTVRCAEFRVSVTDTYAAQTIYVHQVNNSWNESEATWNSRESGTGWTEAGGDFSGTIAGSFAADATGYHSTNLASLTQYWVNYPTNNHGMLLRSTAADGTGEVQFESRNVSNQQPPQLLVDYLPALSISNATVPEGDSTANAVFTVTLSAAHSLTVTVGYATADDTASEPDDYTAISGTLTFAPGVTSQPITVTVKGDNKDEPDETYFVNLSNPTNAIIADSRGLGTITDDDAPPTVAFTATDQSGAENVGTMTVTAQLNAVSGLNVTLPFIVGGTATLGTLQDYTLTDSPVMIPAGSLATTVIITVNDDSLNENAETVVVTMETPTNATLGATTVHTATITDNDPEPTVDFDSDSYSVDEGDVTATITVTLSVVSGRDVTVDYETTNGTATQPDDYTAASGTVTFTAGITTQTFTVDINDDGFYEGPETVNLTLSDPDGATLDGNNPATLSIVDTPPALSINDVTVAEGNSGTVNAVFTVTLGSASSLLVTVDYATADNTATAGSDYITATGTLTFESGVTNQTINVTVQGDSVDEFDETYFVNLSNATNAPIADGQGVGTITDDDEPSSPICSTPVITLTASADTWIDSIAFGQNYGYSDTLKTKSDFSSSNIERALIQFEDLSSIPANSTVTCAEFRVAVTDIYAAQTIYVHQVKESWNESEATWNDRQYGIGWSETGGYYSYTPAGSFAADAMGYRSTNLSSLAQYWVNYPTANFGMLLRSTAADGTGEVQFESREGSNPPRLLVDYLPALSISDVTVTEGNSGTVDAVFTVSLSFADVVSVTVNYDTADNTAKKGSDYTAASGTLVFAPGVTSQTITVTVKGDNKDEAHETYFVNLSSPTNATIADGQGVGTITDDDPTPEVGFSSGSYSVGEAAGGATITVTLSAESGRNVTVDYTTSNGTAEADQDYKPISDTLAFAPGETSKTFAVPIINDSAYEPAPDETVNLTLSAAMNANITPPSTVILTILDDDEALPLQSVYLPLILNGGGGPECGPDSYEPNNWCEEAYGPLTSGQIYQSWISNCDLDTYKKSDYFYIVISTLNTINIYLTGIPSGTDYDLYLYRDPGDDPDDWAARSISTTSSETISYSPQATGRYYIRVYSYSGSSTSPYSLQVTYD